MHRLCQAQAHNGPDEGVEATTILVDGSRNDREQRVHKMVIPTLPSLSLSDRESLAGRSKNSPIEKAVCDRRHIIIKKLCHRVITFTLSGVLCVVDERMKEVLHETRRARFASKGLFCGQQLCPGTIGQALSNASVFYQHQGTFH